MFNASMYMDERLYILIECVMDVSSKLTFYDLLAMLVPGWLIVVGVEFHFGQEIQACVGICSSTFNIPLMLILAYVVGIVWNSMMDFVFCFVRNDITMIQHAFDEGRESKNGFQRLSYIVGASCKLFRHLKCRKSVDDASKLNSYYKCYYYVAKHTYSNAISALEGQVALLRNTIIIVLVGLPPLGIFHAIHLRLVFSVLMYFAMVYRQYRVYELVRDDYKYLSQLENDYETCE